MTVNNDSSIIFFNEYFKVHQKVAIDNANDCDDDIIGENDSDDDIIGKNDNDDHNEDDHDNGWQYRRQ